MQAWSSLRVALFLSRRAITRGSRGIVILTVAMMAVIYAELLFVPSLIQGATDHIEQALRDNVTANVTITPVAPDLSIPNPTVLMTRIRSTPNVQAATATMLVGSQIRFASRVNSWPVLSVDPTSYARTFTSPRSMIEGRFLDQRASDEIVLGVGIAGAGRSRLVTFGTSLQTVHVGDHVSVTLTGGAIHLFVVKGIFDTNFTEANVTAFISNATSNRLIPTLAGKASSIYIKTDRVGVEDRVISHLRKQVPGVAYASWQSLAASVKELTGSFNNIKSIINGVSLAVAAIAVFIVYIDLANRRRTIGIERAIGISGPAITLSYVLKAIVFAALGVLLGAGMFFGGAVPVVRHHPFQFTIGPVMLSPTSSELRSDAIFLVVVAIMGALVPAWRTVRTRLLEAISGQ
jgi:putative ABC transport system permease protein